MRTSMWTAVALAGLLTGAPSTSLAADEAVEAAKASLLEVITAHQEVLPRAKRVVGLAKLDNQDSARALVECLDLLSGRRAALEDQAVKKRAQYEPYKGFSFTDPKAWEIKKRIRQEMDALDDRIRSDSAVAAVFMAQIALLKDKDGLKSLERSMASNSNRHSRRVVYAGLIRNAEVDGAAVGKKAMRDSDAGVRLVTLRAFGIRKDAACVDLAVKALKEKGWPHRQAAARALAEMGDVRAVAPLINAMGIEEGRLVEDYAEALAKITGETLGPYAESWKGWYDDHKEDLVAKGAKAVAAKRPKKIEHKPVDYYGIKTLSRRVVFIIDISGSMKELIGNVPKAEITGKKEGEDPPKGPKIEIAKKTLKFAIRKLGEETYFNVVFYNHAVKMLSESMLKCTQDNKNTAYLTINDLEPSGATWTYGALKETFRMAGRGATDKAYDPGVDTIFLLSDGAPTDDDIDKAKPMKGKVILDAVKEWNRLKKVQIHTIAIDPRVGKGPFIRFMRSLAKQNDGTYTEIGQKSK